jgi:hypothetical protein
VNDRLIHRLDQIENLVGFTGQQGIGVRLGSGVPQGVPYNMETACVAPMSLIEDDDAAEQQELVHKMEKITHFMYCISD